MGDTIEQWRATIGQWSGGKPRNCVTVQHHIAQTSDHICYKYVRFLVLASLLIIGCVELNPGPKDETSTPTQKADAIPTFGRRPGKIGLHGVKTAAFVFARGLNRTEEFTLASNVDGAGDFGDLVFRYRLIDVWKTCFIQLKPTKKVGTIPRSSLTQISGDFGLIKYFMSFCEIKNKAATDPNLKQCGLFNDFEFVIYTNGIVENKSPLQGEISDPLSILSSGTEYGNYITFDKINDKDIFEFFEDLSGCNNIIRELDSLLKSRAPLAKEINGIVKRLQNSVTNIEILGNLNSLESTVDKSYVTKWIDELAKCDFTLFEDFLSKVKIFHSQSNEESFKGLTKKELQGDCKALPSMSSINEKDIFEFFEELSGCKNLIRELDRLLKSRAPLDKQINETVKRLQTSVSNIEILGNLNSLESTVNKSYATKWIDELAKCDFTIFQDFLNKVKIFHSQSNEESFKGLIEKELQSACKASPSIASFIYTRFEECFSKWYKREKNAELLNKNSDLWKTVQKHIIAEIKKISERELEETDGCGIRFNQEHVQKLSDAIKQNTVLNIVTSSKTRILQKLKTYQALNGLGYNNSLFISIKSLMTPRKEINKLWPCKWSDVLVADCDTEGNVTHTVLDILQQSVCCEHDLDISDGNTVESFIEVLQKYQQKLILISTRQETSGFQEQVRNVSYFEDNCNISDFDEKSQEQILKRPVRFQGTNVELLSLVGTDPPESIKALLDSDIISVLLSNEHELIVGRQLCDLCKYYLPRVLHHQLYLKKDILKLTDTEITFAVSGIQADELKKFLPAGVKIGEIVHDERERRHTLVTVSDFSNIGISAECESMKTDQSQEQKIISNDGINNMFENINTEIYASERNKLNYFRTFSKRSETDLNAELENIEVHNEPGQNIKSQEVRYIILGKTNPDREFKKLKGLFANVHWIHVAEESFIWRDTNGNFDIIRRHIDNTKCEKYDVESLVEHSDRTVLLVAEPGMGKSTFLSYMAHKKKEWKPSVWVLRINLNEHTNELQGIEFEHECIDNCKRFLWSAAHSPEQDARKVTEKIFLQALEEPEKMVIILDGFDEISPDYSHKVKMLIRAIRDKTASKIWISSRFAYRYKLEDIVGKIAVTLQPITKPNQIQFLEHYWSEVTEMSNKGNLKMFAEMLLSLCSQSFIDKDGEFTGNPLQTMMLGEAFINEAKEYCCSGECDLPEKFNLISLFKKFTENKFDIYFGDKNKMDISKTEVKRGKKHYVEKHFISALLCLFSPKEINKILSTINASNLKEVNRFLREGTAERIGIITGTVDGKPHFIHRSFAEYFAAIWLSDNFRFCKKLISKHFFNTTNEVTRNLFDRVLAQNSKIHNSVLNNDIHTLEKILNRNTNINILDKGGRTALHLAASYNIPYIQQLLTFPGINTNKRDAVLKWTPLRYADRTKSWLAMDILLQHGANPEDIVFTRPKAKIQKWGQAALWECASKGYTNLLEFMLSNGMLLNASVQVPENLHEKRTLLHRASHCGQVKVVNFLLKRGVDINICDTENNTVLHMAAESGSVEIIKLLQDKGMSVKLTDKSGSTPLHVSAQLGHMEATKTLVQIGADINQTNKHGDTPLMEAANNGKLDIFRYLTAIGADINIRNIKNNTALHLASASGSVDIIKLLLDKGISVNLANSDGFTPLHISAQFGHLQATKTLVERGADVNNTNINGITPLLVAGYNSNLEIFRYITEIGADINIPNAYNNTALHLVSASGCVDIIHLLLDKGISVNLANSDGFSPLHISAQFGHVEATKALVERGVAINNTNKYGDTPLLVAGYNGKLEIFRYLTQIGADINILNTKNNSALHLASALGCVDIIKLLLDKGMSVTMSNSDGFTPLHISAEFGHMEATKTLVDRGSDINKTNKHGNTPLLVAGYNGKLEIFRYLTEIGADIGTPNDYKNTALHLASASGCVDIINILLDKEMSVNMTNSDGFTPLHISAQFGHMEATIALVKRGAAINSINKHGNTPLLVAGYNGKLEIFRYLTELGGDINIRNIKNNTALHLASASACVNIIKLLLDKGMSVNLTNSDGVTPLHISAQFGRLETTKTLVERGAAINNTNKYGDTPLLVAAYNGKLEIFRYLTEKSADINICNTKKNTALHLASASGCVDIIKLLLDKGISVNLANSHGFTPLHISAQFGHLEATKTLVNGCADINKTTKLGNTPLLVAGYNGKFKIFRYFIEIGANINTTNAYNNTALHSVSASGCVDIINILLDRGISVNLANSDGFTPLHISAQCGHLEAAKTLVGRGANINSTNKYGNTPLLVAGYNGNLEIIRYLTEIGADINIPNAYNNTALHVAAESGSVDIIKILLDKGVTVNLTDTDYSTPLHVSAKFGHLEATKYLVERGAAINNTNSDGDTPLTVATRKGYSDICRFLTETGANTDITAA